MTLPIEYSTESGIEVPTIAGDDYLELFERLQSVYSLPLSKIYEASAYSMAMVVRYALGSYAADGNVAALIDNSIAGGIAAATLRHLKNGGANCSAHLLTSQSELPLETIAELDTLLKFGISVTTETPNISSLHTLISGTITERKDQHPKLDTLAPRLNESQIQVHSIIAPPGINVRTGEKNTSALYAAATLSPGLPIHTLQSYYEYVGRHYVNDISIPAQVYRQLGLKNSSLFSEQPVIRIRRHLS